MERSVKNNHTNIEIWNGVDLCNFVHVNTHGSSQVPRHPISGEYLPFYMSAIYLITLMSKRSEMVLSLESNYTFRIVSTLLPLIISKSIQL